MHTSLPSSPGATGWENPRTKWLQPRPCLGHAEHGRGPEKPCRRESCRTLSTQTPWAQTPPSRFLCVKVSVWAKHKEYSF